MLQGVHCKSGFRRDCLAARRALLTPMCDVACKLLSDVHSFYEKQAVVSARQQLGCPMTSIPRRRKRALCARMIFRVASSAGLTSLALAAALITTLSHAGGGGGGTISRNLLTPVLSVRQQHTFKNNQAQSLYYTDIGPDLGYSINTTAIPMSLTKAASVCAGTRAWASMPSSEWATRSATTPTSNAPAAL